MSRAGLSELEQRKYVTDFMQTSPEYYTVKEVVSKISKSNKKLREEVVEGILNMLVDDKVIQKEKVGTLNIVWSFPRDAERAQRQRRQLLSDKCAAERAKQVSLAERLEQGRTQREKEGGEGVRLREDVYALKERVAQKQAALEALKSAKPVNVHDKVRAVQNAKTAINRWIDNFYSLESYFTGSGFGNTEEFYQMMGVTTPPEYIE